MIIDILFEYLPHRTMEITLKVEISSDIAGVTFLY